MTLTQSIAEHAGDGDAQALFEEARRRRRRRRAVVVGFVAAALVSAIVLQATGSGGTGPRPPHAVSGRGHPGGASGDQSSASARTVTSVALPARYWVNQVSTAGGNLRLTGTLPSTRLATQCVSALMDPVTLEIGKVTRGNCDDPALWGETVLAVSPRPDDGLIAIAHLDADTGTVSTGPTVMTYSYSSDTQDLETYGGGWLWIYDEATTNGPEVLQVSETTGQVIDKVSVPALYRPILAADADGLWLGNTVSGNPLSSAVWHVAPGARSAVGVGPASQFVSWLVAGGDHLWAGIAQVGGTGRKIWRFDGPTWTVGFSAPDRYDTTGVVGGESGGLWAAVADPPLVGHITRSPTGVWRSPGQNTRQDIVQIDPDTGSETVRTAIRPAPTLTAETGTVVGQSTYLDGSFFILQPPFRANGYLGYELLVRVRS
jgi:hypothetical protein